MSKSPELIIIAAISDNNVIGKDGGIPWRIPEDMKRFKKLTLEHPIVIMGRKTYESIPPKFRPLPERRNIVLSRNLEYKIEGVETAHSREDVVKMCGNQDAYIMGGAQVYEMFLPLVNRMEITRVHINFTGDAFFPEVNWDEWKEVDKELREGYSFLSYVRKS